MVSRKTLMIISILSFFISTRLYSGNFAREEPRFGMTLKKGIFYGQCYLTYELSSSYFNKNGESDNLNYNWNDLELFFSGEYGFTSYLMLGISIPYRSLKGEQIGSEDRQGSGFSDLRLRARYNFYINDKKSLFLTTGVAVRLPTGKWQNLSTNELAIGSGYNSIRLSGYLTKHLSLCTLNGWVRYYLNGTKKYENGDQSDIGEGFSIFSEAIILLSQKFQFEPGINLYFFAGNSYKPKTAGYPKEKYDGGWRLTVTPNFSFSETEKLVIRGGFNIPLLGTNTWKWYGIYLETNYKF
jgi:hypothetical protein